MMYVNCMNAQLQMKLFLLQMMDRKLQQLRMFIQHTQLFIIQIICNPQNISHNVWYLHKNSGIIEVLL